MQQNRAGKSWQLQQPLQLVAMKQAPKRSLAWEHRGSKGKTVKHDLTLHTQSMTCNITSSSRMPEAQDASAGKVSFQTLRPGSSHGSQPTYHNQNAGQPFQ